MKLQANGHEDQLWAGNEVGGSEVVKEGRRAGARMRGLEEACVTTNQLWTRSVMKDSRLWCRVRANALMSLAWW